MKVQSKGLNLRIHFFLSRNNVYITFGFRFNFLSIRQKLLRRLRGLGCQNIVICMSTEDYTWTEKQEQKCIFFSIFNSGRTSSVGRALDCRTEGRGFDSRGRTNTQGLKISEK